MTKMRAIEDPIFLIGDLASAIGAGDAREACALIVEDYARIPFGALPSDPVEAVKEACAAIAKAIRAEESL